MDRQTDDQRETIIPRHYCVAGYKNRFIFDPVQERDKLKFHRLSGATFYDCINTICHFIKSFLDDKCLVLRNMEPLIEPFGKFSVSYLDISK